MEIAKSNLIKTATGFVEVPKGFLERKDISYASAEIKDIDFKNKIVMSYWSAFGNKDFDEDIMMPGCYKKTIAESGPQGSNGIFYLQSHRWTKPLGKPTVLLEDNKGLYAETPVTSGATFAEDTLKLMAAGLMIQNSVGFVTIKDMIIRPDENDWSTWYREIYEVKLREGSAVVLGANDDTPFEGFKSMSENEVRDLRQKIMSTIKSGNMRDETYIRLELALDQLYSETYILGTKNKSLEEKQPSKLSAECPNCKAMNEYENTDAMDSEMECSACKCMFTKSYTVKSFKPVQSTGYFNAISSIKIN